MLWRTFCWHDLTTFVALTHQRKFIERSLNSLIKCSFLTLIATFRMETPPSSEVSGRLNEYQNGVKSYGSHNISPTQIINDCSPYHQID